MSDVINPDRKIELSILNQKDLSMICKVGRALAVPDRVRILRSLLLTSKSLSDIASELDIPISTVSRHIDILAAAQLIFVRYHPGPKGHTKYCSQMAVGCDISLRQPLPEDPPEQAYSVELPIGMFSDCKIKPPCGMTGGEGFLGVFDEPNIFFLPDRIKAECIWFDLGFISYRFPTAPLYHHPCREISFSFEICSETVYYNNDWPSDITVLINDTEVTTFTSPGDFGGRRGRYTPDYWAVSSTQFGLLKTVTVTENGVFVDSTFVHDRLKFSDLDLYGCSDIRLTIGVKDDAEHRGGINLFGKNFGDYPQSIIMTVK